MSNFFIRLNGIHPFLTRILELCEELKERVSFNDGFMIRRLLMRHYNTYRSDLLEKDFYPVVRSYLLTTSSNWSAIVVKAETLTRIVYHQKFEDGVGVAKSAGNSTLGSILFD